MKQKHSEPDIQSSFSSKSGQSYAPFGSVSPRGKKKKKGQQKDQLGPGSYDIAFPIIKPLIQTIKKKNNNIIVKLAHLGTSSFQCEQQRFSNDTSLSNQYVQQIGPGKYSPQKSAQFLENSRVDRSFQLPKRKLAGEELAKFIKNRERRAATFSEVKKISIQEYVEMPKVQNQKFANLKHDQDKKNGVKGACWSMMKQERLKNAKNPYENIGPGQYYVDDFAKKPRFKKMKSVSEEHPVFRSESIRSFFDNIRFETNQSKKALIRQAIGYKSHSLGPGTYDISKGQNKQSKFQFFGSTVQRG